MNAPDEHDELDAPLPVPQPRRTLDVLAACDRCRDVFEVTLIIRRDTVEISPTTAARQEADHLIHRPAVCGGTLKLYATGLRNVSPADSSAKSERE